MPIDPQTELLKPEQSDTTETVANNLTQITEEFGGSVGPEPTRYGDWEKNGRCIDF